jgi:AAA+ ATPase superfamily predicted ATPase
MNPFLISGYESPKYFCDRKIEVEKIVNVIENSRNLTLISERRIGKTSLLKHVEFKLTDSIVFVYVDLYPTLRLKDFIQVLSNNIIEKLEPFSDKVIRKITSFFAALQPKFSFNPETGVPGLEFTVNNSSEAEKSVSLLFEYIRNSDKKIVIAFDEFQQILKYPEKNVEALLRSEIQKDNNASFIFSGSQTHLLISMFNEYSRPFYNSSQTMYLDRIEQSEYTKFIIKNFKSHNFFIDDETAKYIYEIGNGITYNIQYLCHKLFSEQEKRITSDLAKKLLNEILKENEVVYFNYRELLTSLQYQILKAVAKEFHVEKPYSIQFLSKYKLDSSSSARTAINALIEKGLLINLRGIHVTDWFFSLWLKQQP